MSLFASAVLWRSSFSFAKRSFFCCTVSIRTATLVRSRGTLGEAEVWPSNVSASPLGVLMRTGLLGLRIPLGTNVGAFTLSKGEVGGCRDVMGGVKGDWT